jgi:predicted XRE-type DNA-binding protein
MMKKNKHPSARTAEELAALLGLSKEDGIEMELRSELNAKIIEVVKERKLTHAETAKLTGTSRTRITALLNCNTQHISTSLMIRILAGLGIRVRITYSPTKLAA